MTKRFFILGSALAVMFGVSAEILSPEEALNRLRSGERAKIASQGKIVAEPVYTMYSVTDEPTVYVFPQEGGKGYVMLSADDIAAPVLGYSEESNFDLNNIPPQLEWWMNEYTREISVGRQNVTISTFRSPGVTENQERIDPLMKTKWNQDAPYNNDCPTIRGQRCYTGCVATSMAQVMNYFHYPEKGEGTSRFVCAGIGRLELNYASKKFDWSNMLDSYASGEYNEAQADAVAYLMKACGYAVEMAYGTDASGASSLDISKGMLKYFNYDGNIRYEMRMAYSASEWSTIIYNNLKNVGPVIYNGNSPYGGHSFVCDGYDGNGYFHFNWGWGGSADGYFMLNALNPMTQGIGGSQGGFNSHQDIILGIQVPNGEPVVKKKPQILQYGALHGELDANDIKLTFTNWNPTGISNFTSDKFKCNIGVIMEPINGSNGETIYEKASNYDVLTMSDASIYSTNSGFLPIVAVPAGLVDGEYKVTFASKVTTDKDAEWTPSVAPYGYPNHFFLKKEGTKISLTNVEVPMLKIESMEPLSDFYYGYPIKMKMLLKNDTEFELTQTIVPALSVDGVTSFIGDSQLFTLASGETSEIIWDITWQEQAGAKVPSSGSSIIYTLSANNPDADISYGNIGELKMSRLKARNNFRSRGLEILNSEIYNDDKYGAVYEVKDPSRIEIQQKVEVVSGFFAYPMAARIYTEMETQPGYLQLEMDQRFNEIPFISSGNVEPLTCVVEYPEAVSDKLYYLRTVYVQNNTSNQLGQVKFIANATGIEMVNNDIDIVLEYSPAEKVALVCAENGLEMVKVYKADGSELNVVTYAASDTAELDFSKVGDGVVIVSIVDASHKHKTFKIAL